MDQQLSDAEAMRILRSLTRDEMTVLYFRLAGFEGKSGIEMKNPDIGQAASVSVSVVSHHFGEIYEKFKCQNQNAQQNWKCLNAKVNRLYEKVVLELLHKDPEELKNWPMYGYQEGVEEIQPPILADSAEAIALPRENIREEEADRLQSEKDRLQKQAVELQVKESQIDQQQDHLNKRAAELEQNEVNFQRKSEEQNQRLKTETEAIRAEKEQLQADRKQIEGQTDRLEKWEAELIHREAAAQQMTAEAAEIANRQRAEAANLQAEREKLEADRRELERQKNQFAQEQAAAQRQPERPIPLTVPIPFRDRLRHHWQRWMTCAVFLIILVIALSLIFRNLPLGFLPSPTATSPAHGSFTQPAPTVAGSVFPVPTDTSVGIPASSATNLATATVPPPPVSTHTPIPPGTVLFTEDFSNIADMKITPDSGDWSITNEGRFLADSPLLISFGELNWTNYELTLNAKTVCNSDFYIGVRASRSTHMIAIRGCGGWMNWGVFNPDWAPIANSFHSVPDENYDITVQGNTYTSSGFSESFPWDLQGKVYLHLDRGQTIDNIKVISLP